MLKISEENWKIDPKPTKTAEKLRAMNTARRFLKLAETLGDQETITAIEAYWPDLKE